MTDSDSTPTQPVTPEPWRMSDDDAQLVAMKARGSDSPSGWQVAAEYVEAAVALGIVPNPRQHGPGLCAPIAIQPVGVVCSTAGHEEIPAATSGLLDDGQHTHPASYCTECSETMERDGEYTVTKRYDASVAQPVTEPDPWPEDRAAIERGVADAAAGRTVPLPQPEDARALNLFETKAKIEAVCEHDDDSSVCGRCYTRLERIANELIGEVERLRSALAAVSGREPGAAVPPVPVISPDAVAAWDRLNSFGDGLVGAVRRAKAPVVEQDLVTVLLTYSRLVTYVEQMRAIPIVEQMLAAAPQAETRSVGPLRLTDARCGNCEHCPEFRQAPENPDETALAAAPVAGAEQLSKDRNVVCPEHGWLCSGSSACCCADKHRPPAPAVRDATAVLASEDAEALRTMAVDHDGQQVVPLTVALTMLVQAKPTSAVLDDALQRIVRCLRGEGARDAGYLSVDDTLRVIAIRDVLATRGLWPEGAEIGDRDPDREEPGLASCVETTQEDIVDDLLAREAHSSLAASNDQDRTRRRADAVTPYPSLAQALMKRFRLEST